MRDHIGVGDCNLGNQWAARQSEARERRFIARQGLSGCALEQPLSMIAGANGPPTAIMPTQEASHVSM